MAKLINQSGISTKKVRQIIRFVKPKRVVLPTIIIKKSKDIIFGGECYTLDGKHYVEVKITNDHKNLPIFVRYYAKTIKKNGYITDFWLKNKKEILIWMLGHELKHLSFTQRGKYRNSKREERIADQYALSKLRENRLRKKV